MILGVGVDLLNISRVKELYSKFNIRLPKKILSSEEFELFISSKNKESFLAKKFSSKEAFCKALGIGIGRGIDFKDITIKHDIFGKPIIVLSPNKYEIIENLFKQKIENIKFNISITDKTQYVNTFVVISASQ